MTLNELLRLRILPVVLMAAVTVGTALAERPEWTNQGQSGKNEKKGQDKGKKKQQGGQEVRIGAYFGDQQRVVTREYYDKQYRAGRCPPGLAKKNNGCMPPGQAKKWNVGQPLPRDVVYYPLPQSLVIGLGAPPAGHNYVRVGSDILLMALATNLIVDAIPALGRP
jgi:Ni/Co efflux regulator RcnB